MLGIGCGSDTSEGGGQLARNGASSDVVRYLVGGVHCLIISGKGSSIFGTVAGFQGTVDKDPAC